jgi:hypothetical protein
MTRNYYEIDGRIYHFTSEPSGTCLDPGPVKLTQKEGKRRYKEQAAADLREILKPGQVIYTILRSRSASGMSREISLCVVQDGRARDLDYLASRVLDLTIKKHGLVVKGCGMDMGFHLVYNLGCALWPDGTPEPHGRRNGVPDSDGGYALKQEWL